MQIFQTVKNGGMSICVSCAHRKVCKGIDNQPCVECNQFMNEDKQPQTNADRIRAMTDEELAKFLVSVENSRRGNSCGAVWHLPHVALEWLQKPAEGDV